MDLLPAVEKVLACLPPRQREAFTRRMAGETYQQIGEAQGLTPQGARSRCLLVSRKIRWYLERSGRGAPDLQERIDRLIRSAPHWR